MSDEKLPGEEKTIDGDVVPNTDSAPAAGLEREDAEGLELNDIGRVRIRVKRPLVGDPYLRDRATGAFILIEEGTNDTVAGGMIR